MEFESALDRSSRLHHGLVLLRVTRREGGGKDIFGPSAEEARLVPARAAIGEGAIDDDIASGYVLQKKDDIRQGVEKRLHHSMIVEKASLGHDLD
jgi:hypothetical protein